ncbi:MAG: bifunctional 5,10-methylenetetrahydrofolate dehydrogenase/5,10-methenyltetrahydrofolate cyclohydrolase [bacterium]|nr:bifunctional 5,10-methylenetetrahydrofolate dehydrogenase/5,10-methenyltetrahydrofolate cyclohydrolase [bacterium]
MILLSGKKISEKIENEALKIVHVMRKKNIVPHLAVILVGHRADSELYVAIKKKKASELGIDFSLYRFEEDESEESVIETINYLNDDRQIHGIIVQLPLPSRFDTEKVLKTINREKDVDDLNGLGKYSGPSSMAVVTILDEYKIETSEKNIVIVGRGRLVGQPLAKLLEKRGLNVESVDIDTHDLIRAIRGADILIAATGTPGIITEELVKKGSVVISMGNEVNFDKVKNRVEAITPVTGGVGPITVALLFKNTADAAQGIR